MIEIFNSDRYFVFFDFVISHGQLLLRSQKSEDLGSNIDIIFYDAKYIQAATGWRGIRISRVEDYTDIINYESVKKHLAYENNHLFAIETGGETQYIVASFFGVFENQLEFHESSLNHQLDRGKKVATSMPN